MEDREYFDTRPPQPEPILPDPGMIASATGMRARDPWEMVASSGRRARTTPGPVRGSMQTAIVSSAVLGRLGRWDAATVILYTQHQPLVDELVERLTAEQLVTLALELPYDEEAARKVQHGNAFRGEGTFRSWLAAKGRRPTDLAIYCAAAAQRAVAKQLGVVEELRQQEIVMIRGLNALLSQSLARHCPLLHQALAGGSAQALSQPPEYSI